MPHSSLSMQMLLIYISFDQNRDITKVTSTEWYKESEVNRLPSIYWHLHLQRCDRFWGLYFDQNRDITKVTSTEWYKDSEVNRVTSIDWHLHLQRCDRFWGFRWMALARRFELLSRLFALSTHCNSDFIPFTCCQWPLTLKLRKGHITLSPVPCKIEHRFLYALRHCCSWSIFSISKMLP